MLCGTHTLRCFVATNDTFVRITQWQHDAENPFSHTIERVCTVGWDPLGALARRERNRQIVWKSGFVGRPSPRQHPANSVSCSCCVPFPSLVLITHSPTERYVTSSNTRTIMVIRTTVYAMLGSGWRMIWMKHDYPIVKQTGLNGLLLPLHVPITSLE